MVNRQELRGFIVLEHLTDEMLDRLGGLVDRLNFEEGDLIFREGDPAERFYMLWRGKILMEQRIAPSVTISLGTIKPSYSFGWSAMLEGGAYTVDTICADPSEVFSIRSAKIRRLLDSDPAMGYRLTRQLLRMVKNRLDRRTTQLIKLFRSHPDMQSVLGPEDHEEAVVP